MSISAMKQALEALEGLWDDGFGGVPESMHKDAIAALRQAIAEAQKQEPVAFVSGYTNGECVVMPMNPAVVFSVGTALYNAPVHASDISQERVDETAKDKHEDWYCQHQWQCGYERGWDAAMEQKREWVGLTDEEREELLETKDWGGSLIAATEAKLKEKNT